ILLFLTVPSSPATAGPVSPAVSAELRRLTQSLLDAIAPGDKAVWQRLTHEDFIHVDENDTVRTKAELLKELDPLPAGLEGHLAIADWKASQHGDVVVVTHEDDETLMYYGQLIKSRFRSTDTWKQFKGRRWQLIATQTLA